MISVGTFVSAGPSVWSDLHFKLGRLSHLLHLLACFS
eukprot:COSAG01_NODE_1760_length_9301_cov_8.687242_5_plen_37_part_00